MTIVQALASGVIPFGPNRVPVESTPREIFELLHENWPGGNTLWYDYDGNEYRPRPSSAPRAVAFSREILCFDSGWKGLWIYFTRDGVIDYIDFTPPDWEPVGEDGSQRRAHIKPWIM